MSSFNFFREKGYQQLAPIYREISNAVVATTITLYTPPTGSRLAVTNLAISANTAGTMAFYWLQSANQNEFKLAQFTVGGSSTIVPVVNWESTAVVAPLGVRFSHGATNGWAVTVEGFQLYDN